MATKIEGNATWRQRQRRCQYKPDSEPAARPASSIAATAPSRVADQFSCAQPSSIAGVMSVPNRADDEQRIHIGEARQRVEARALRRWAVHPNSIGVRVSSPVRRVRHDEVLFESGGPDARMRQKNLRRHHHAGLERHIVAKSPVGSGSPSPMGINRE